MGEGWADVRLPFPGDSMGELRVFVVGTKVWGMSWSSSHSRFRSIASSTSRPERNTGDFSRCSFWTNNENSRSRPGVRLSSIELSSRASAFTAMYLCSRSTRAVQCKYVASARMAHTLCRLTYLSTMDEHISRSRSRSNSD